jgi:hypothetical protein
MPPNVTGKFLSAYGKYYQLHSAGGGFGTEKGYDAAVTDCASAAKGGQLAVFKYQYQQWFVESMLMPDNLTGVVDAYWVASLRNYARGTSMVTSVINTTWIWGDTLQYIGPLPRNESSGLVYSRWAAGEPTYSTATGKPHKGCATAVRSLAWDTLGPHPTLSRMDGPLAVWAWKTEDCSYTRAYICELKCEQPLSRAAAWYLACAVAQGHAAQQQAGSCSSHSVISACLVTLAPGGMRCSETATAAIGPPPPGLDSLHRAPHWAHWPPPLTG